MHERFCTGNCMYWPCVDPCALIHVRRCACRAAAGGRLKRGAGLCRVLIAAHVTQDEVTAAAGAPSRVRGRAAPEQRGAGADACGDQRQDALLATDAGRAQGHHGESHGVLHRRRLRRRSRLCCPRKLAAGAMCCPAAFSGLPLVTIAQTQRTAPSCMVVSVLYRARLCLHDVLGAAPHSHVQVLIHGCGPGSKAFFPADPVNCPECQGAWRSIVSQHLRQYCLPPSAACCTRRPALLSHMPTHMPPHASTTHAGPAIHTSKCILLFFKLCLDRLPRVPGPDQAGAGARLSCAGAAGKWSVLVVLASKRMCASRLLRCNGGGGYHVLALQASCLCLLLFGVASTAKVVGKHIRSSGGAGAGLPRAGAAGGWLEPASSRGFIEQQTQPYCSAAASPPATQHAMCVQLNFAATCTHAGHAQLLCSMSCTSQANLPASQLAKLLMQASNEASGCWSSTTNNGNQDDRIMVRPPAGLFLGHQHKLAGVGAVLKCCRGCEEA